MTTRHTLITANIIKGRQSSLYPWSQSGTVLRIGTNVKKKKKRIGTNAARNIERINLNQHSNFQLTGNIAIGTRHHTWYRDGREDRRVCVWYFLWGGSTEICKWHGGLNSGGGGSTVEVPDLPIDSVGEA